MLKKVVIVRTGQNNVKRLFIQLVILVRNKEIAFIIS